MHRMTKWNGRFRSRFGCPVDTMRTLIPRRPRTRIGNVLQGTRTMRTGPRWGERNRGCRKSWSLRIVIMNPANHCRFKDHRSENPPPLIHATNQAAKTPCHTKRHHHILRIDRHRKGRMEPDNALQDPDSNQPVRQPHPPQVLAINPAMFLIGPLQIRPSVLQNLIERDLRQFGIIGHCRLRIIERGSDKGIPKRSAILGRLIIPPIKRSPPTPPGTIGLAIGCEPLQIGHLAQMRLHHRNPVLIRPALRTDHGPVGIVPFRMMAARDQPFF